MNYYIKPILLALTLFVSQSFIDKPTNSRDEFPLPGIKNVEIIYDINSEPRKNSIQVVATCYNAVPSQCNKDVQHTASMFKLNLDNPIEHRIIAISRDLETLGFNLGDSVYVEVKDTSIYDGVWYIEDRMNKRWTNKIDFLVNKESYIDKFGNVTITKL